MWLNLITVNVVKWNRLVYTSYNDMNTFIICYLCVRYCRLLIDWLFGLRSASF